MVVNLAKYFVNLGWEFSVRTTSKEMDHSLCKQVAMWAGFEVLVTPHGQQVTNVVFSPKNSLVIEIAPEHYDLQRESEWPTMFRYESRDSDFRHRVVFSSGHDRTDMVFPMDSFERELEHWQRLRHEIDSPDGRDAAE
jgi:hypothetical protein